MNFALTGLGCAENQLTSLDLSQNIALIGLICGEPLGSGGNLLTSLDVSQNTNLDILYVQGNQLTSLDVSNNPLLNWFRCDNNQLTSLDVRNGNNTNLNTANYHFNTTNNPQLTCINVDDPVYSTATWTYIDPQHYFSNNCNTTSIQDPSLVFAVSS